MNESSRRCAIVSFIRCQKDKSRFHQVLGQIYQSEGIHRYETTRLYQIEEPRA